MNFILALQQKLTPQPDKLGHFYWGFWYALASLLLYHFVIHWIYIIILPSITLAAIKEIVDKVTGKGNAEFLDFIFTIIPALVFLGLVSWGWC